MIQAAEQAELVKIQEEELNSKRAQLESLRREEQRLEEQKIESMNKLDGLTSNLQDTQFCISQAKALITQLQEQTRQMNDGISSCGIAIELGDATQVPDAALRIEPEFRDPDYNKVLMTNGNISKETIFDVDPFSNTNEIPNRTDDTFDNDPFKNDPFKNKDAISNVPFKTFTISNFGWKRKISNMC
ncbi:epidermal growth factor receptor substrate 15-like 1 [Anoplophora glabripennis]|uniref:epidermal growth factor receptor substrate 15-like 1 n=1 Tax=Anoplophora glabripennis TaxID=217634 RepID=UPI000874EA24|nr:epidermal growth factor receptor substrate 15-like 1 [Anoplophora glabripennis]